MTQSQLLDSQQSDNQKVRELQKEYSQGNDKALAEMYEILRKVALKTINTIAQKDNHVKKLSYAEKEQKAHDSTTYIIEQYIRRPDFFIKKSAVSYVYLRVKKELYYVRKCDKMLEFTDEL